MHSTEQLRKKLWAIKSFKFRNFGFYFYLYLQYIFILLFFHLIHRTLWEQLARNGEPCVYLHLVRSARKIDIYSIHLSMCLVLYLRLCVRFMLSTDIKCKRLRGYQTAHYIRAPTELQQLFTLGKSHLRVYNYLLKLSIINK